MFEFESFYFRISKPVLENVKLEANINSCIVTNSAGEHFLQDEDIIIVGKRAESDIRLKIIGISSGKENTKDVPPIPSKSVHRSTDNSEQSSKFLERLWGFLTAQKILKGPTAAKQIQVLSPLPPDPSCTENIFERFGFITNFTSLIVTESDPHNPGYRLETPPELVVPQVGGTPESPSIELNNNFDVPRSTTHDVAGCLAPPRRSVFSKIGSWFENLFSSGSTYVTTIEVARPKVSSLTNTCW